MSYSFNVRAANKEAAKAAVAVKFDEMIAAGQPMHARDRAAALANANAVIDLLADDDTKDLVVSLNGYVSWSSHYDVPVSDATLTAAAVTASAGYTPRDPA